MTKRFFTLILLIASVTAVMAIPAKRGVKKTITLTNGKQVEVTLKGDEHLHFWTDDAGTNYINNGSGQWEELSSEKLNQRKKQAAVRRGQLAQSRAPLRASATEQPRSIIGKKKGIIILVNFSDKEFATGHDQKLYNNVANTEGYTDANGFCGSVHDYFLDQSNGLFDLTFDVVGPVTLSNPYSYYGENDESGNDQYAGAMVVEACKAVDDQVDFSAYDWNGNGEVDQVFILYAGEGENGYGDSKTIWPHEFELRYSDYGKKLKLDNVSINTYACSSELCGTIDGIGTICHEFSHCLGYPDMYDTNYKNYGMDRWDLMDSGSYNGNAFRPAGFTGYEKWMAGWITPTELTEDCEVTDMKAQSENGDCYIIYNKANRNEYYLLDNRQKTSWDSALPGKGLLIMHADYDSNIWYYNEVNTVGGDFSNTHQRFTIFHADNEDGTGSSAVAGDPYPYKTNNSLSNTSKPKASLYNANTDGSKLMNCGIYDITQNADGTISFRFEGHQDNNPNSYYFYESFDDCNGKGGNDGKWSGTGVATSTFYSDNEDWTCSSKNGAYQCAKFGNSSKAGETTSPYFSFTGEATLTFKCAPWGTDGTALQVYLCDNQEKQDLIQTVTMTANQWTEVSVDIEGNGVHCLYFSPAKRFFLDEVMVTPKGASGIRDLQQSRPAAHAGVYSLDGRYLGTDTKNLRSGLYILNGKKVSVKN